MSKKKEAKATEGIDYYVLSYNNYPKEQEESISKVVDKKKRIKTNKNSTKASIYEDIKNVIKNGGDKLAIPKNLML